jgi:ribosomal protein S12 methylthiotransferase
MTPMPARPDHIDRVAFVSLGCPKNLVDSEKMLALLQEGGVQPVNESDKPDAIVVNTCGFLEASKEESLGVIRDAIERKERGELKRVVVAGCLVQRHRAKLLEWAPGIDAMIGVFDRDHIVDAVRGAPPERPGLDAERPRYWIAANALQAAKERGMQTVGLTVNGADGKGVGYFEGDANRFRLTPRHWAYLRASEGCNQRCAFCTIPSIRGKMRSKPMSEIVTEAGRLMDDGAFELNVIGQDTTSWGMDIGDPRGLVGLLESLDGVAREHGGGWIRLMYAYPSTFTDAMVDAMARLPNVVKYIDMPLQHASDQMLSRMRRHTSAERSCCGVRDGKARLVDDARAHAQQRIDGAIDGREHGVQRVPRERGVGARKRLRRRVQLHRRILFLCRTWTTRVPAVRCRFVQKRGR